MNKNDLKFVPKNVKIESSDMKFTLTFSDFSMIDDGVSVMRFAMPNLEGILKNIKDDKRTVSANLSFFANGKMLSFFFHNV